MHGNCDIKPLIRIYCPQIHFLALALALTLALTHTQKAMGIVCMTRILGIMLQARCISSSSRIPYSSKLRFAVYFAATAAASSLAALVGLAAGGTGSLVGAAAGAGLAGLSVLGSGLTGPVPAQMYQRCAGRSGVELVGLTNCASYRLTRRRSSGSSISLGWLRHLSGGAGLIRWFCLGACGCRGARLLATLAFEDSFEFVHNVES